MIATRTYTQSQYTILYVFISCLFLIQPVGALAVLLLVCYASPSMGQRIWHRNIIFLIIFSILLLAIINSSKVNDNDLFYYVRWFKQSGKTDLLSYLSGQKKKSEAAYATYVWCVNHFISSKEEIYKILTTVIQYIFLNLATLKFCRKTTVNKGVVMAAVMLTCFNPYVFSLSIQLLRQSLAISIFIYVMVERCLYQKTHWILLILCPTIHTMTLLPVILLFIPILDKPIKKNITAYSIVLLIIGSIRLISGYLLSLSIFSDSTASYALQRASATKVFDLGEASPASILLAVTILVTSFYCSQMQTRNATDNTSNGLRHLFNIPAIIAVFVLLNVNLSEIFARFLMLLYPFISLIFAALFRTSKISRLMFLFGSIMILAIFIYLTLHSVWSYTNLDNLLKSGLLYLVV